MELLQGATPICEGSCRLTSLERQEVWNDCRSCKVRISSKGNLLWKASVFLGRKKDDRGVTEGREDVREVFQQRRSGAKRKLSKCGRNQMGNELILALPEGADDFVVYYDARSKDLEAGLEKGEDKVQTSIRRDVRTLAIEEAYMKKYSIHPGADTMFYGFRLRNRWLSMKKDVASYDTNSLQEMDDLNITMEEYIRLMANKARGHDQTFNWETAMYSKEYCNDLDSFTDFETDFLVIVYNDASTSNQNVSSEPTVSIYNAIKADIDFHISFSDSKDEDYTFIYNKDSSSYKLIPVDDLKPEPVNDHVEINIELCSENIDIKPIDNVICISNDTTPIKFDENIETNHDTPRSG
ncbi:hypothetical protein Tco_1243421 [Tanacetum coccineum]